MSTTNGVEEALELRRSVRLARDVVDSVLLELGRLGSRVNRRALLEGLESSRAALDDLERCPDGEPRRVELFEVARSRLVGAIDALAEVDVPDAERLGRRLISVSRSIERGREAAIEVALLDEGDSRSMRQRLSRDGAAGASVRFAASLGVPQLHVLPRGPLRTRVDAAIPEDFSPPEVPDDEGMGDPLPDEDSLASLLGSTSLLSDDLARADDDVPAEKRLEVLLDGPSGDPARAPGLDGELAQLRRMARACLDDIGTAANLRRLEASERYDWASMERYEQRMCDALDALVSLGLPFRSASHAASLQPGLDVLEEALLYGREALTADPSRAFARAFVLGCVDGEDAVRAVVLALKQSPRYTLLAQTQALSVATNPAIDDALAGLCRERDPELLRVGLDGLYARGSVDLGMVAPLVEHIDDSVRARAYRLLGLAREREVAMSLLAERLGDELAELAAVSAAEALALLGSELGVAHARARLVEALEDEAVLPREARLRYLTLLGIAGTRDDHVILGSLYRGGEGEAAALGLHGHVALAELLVEALVRPSERTLFGPSQRGEAAAALVRITGAPLVVTAGDPYVASTDAAAWAAAWERLAPDLDRERRYRWGRLWSPSDPLLELTADGVPMTVRRQAALELAIALGEAPVMLHAFARTQRECLGRARATVEARIAERSLRAGGWR